MIWILLIPSILLIISCASPFSRQDGIRESRTLIEIGDLYTAGHEEIEAAIKARPELGRMLDSNLAATLLITLVIEYEDGERERIQQSGCFIYDGRFILTAGHGFFAGSGKLVGLEALTISNQSLDLAVAALGPGEDPFSSDDWAILTQVEPRPSMGLHLAGSSFGGGQAILLGYPGGMALNDSNRVIHALEVEGGATYPLAVICDRSLTRPNILVPKVGAIPIRGMSGAPVLDESGALIGLFSSISRTRGVRGWHYIFHMADIPLSTLDSLMQN